MAKVQTSKTFDIVQVFLISSRIPGKREIGDPPALGPYMWILAEHEEAFIDEMRKRYRDDHRVVAVRALARREGVSRKDVEALTLEASINLFEEYLAQPGVWEV